MLTLFQHFAFATRTFNEYGSNVKFGTTSNEQLLFTTAGYATGKRRMVFLARPLKFEG